jgi:hypothetical protein
MQLQVKIHDSSEVMQLEGDLESAIDKTPRQE